MLATETDLYGPGQEAFVVAFNRRLTKRIARTCSLNVVPEQETGVHLSGGLRLNFNFRKPVKVRNEVFIHGSLQTFDTDFIFSTKTTLIVQVNDKETAADMLHKVISRFKILEGGATLSIFERELSVSQEDIFYRELDPAEIPLRLSILWSVNRERKSFVVTDHDPNATKYKNCELRKLERKLENLNAEEEEAVQSVFSKYGRLREEIGRLINETSEK